MNAEQQTPPRTCPYCGVLDGHEETCPLVQLQRKLRTVTNQLGLLVADVTELLDLARALGPAPPDRRLE